MISSFDLQVRGSAVDNDYASVGRSPRVPCLHATSERQKLLLLCACVAYQKMPQAEHVSLAHMPKEEKERSRLGRDGRAGSRKPGASAHVA